MTGLMEATQMMVDIDGDVLVFLELAQVRWQRRYHSNSLNSGLCLPTDSEWGEAARWSWWTGWTPTVRISCLTGQSLAHPPSRSILRGTPRREASCGGEGTETFGNHRAGEGTPVSCVDSWLLPALGHLRDLEHFPSKIHCPPPYSRTNYNSNISHTGPELVRKSAAKDEFMKLKWI